MGVSHVFHRLLTLKRISEHRRPKLNYVTFRIAVHSGRRVNSFPLRSLFLRRRLACIASPPSAAPPAEPRLAAPATSRPPAASPALTTGPPAALGLARPCNRSHLEDLGGISASTQDLVISTDLCSGIMTRSWFQRGEVFKIFGRGCGGKRHFRQTRLLGRVAGQAFRWR